MRIISVLVFFIIALTSAVYAADNAEKPSPDTMDKVTVQIKQALSKLVNPASLVSLQLAKSPVPGLYEVILGGHVLYVTEDGNYLISGGDIMDLQQDGKNLTEERRNSIRLDTLSKVNPDQMIRFKPEGKTKHVLTAFTDVDCFYCAKLHKEVTDLNKAGIEVRYLAFPRSGINSETYKTMVSVWCADNPQQAMTDAKAGKEIAAKTCSNPIASQYELGRQMGVSGTPALIMPNGELMPGYAPADKLVQYLDDLDK